MRFSVAAAITMAAGAFAGVVTETVTDYTTYCPEATSIVHGGSTYSVPSVCFPSYLWLRGLTEGMLNAMITRLIPQDDHYQPHPPSTIIHIYLQVLIVHR